MNETITVRSPIVTDSRLNDSPIAPNSPVMAKTADCLKRTPLFDSHVRSGAQMVNFGGWKMPVRFDDVVREHQALREAAGLFDISHMGEIGVMGRGAPEFLNRMLTNDVRRLAVGEGQYSLLCKESGGVLDDLFVFRLGEFEFLLVANASRVETDMEWLQAHQYDVVYRGMADLMDLSEVFGAVALQGPRAAEIADACFPGPSLRAAQVERPSDLKRNEIGVFAERRRVYVSRTGCGVEDGFEIRALADELPGIWDLLLERGRALGCRPAGLGARDTLRTEAGRPVHGRELNEDCTPIEAGLADFVALEKREFVGRDVLLKQEQDGVSKKLVAFEMRGDSPTPRPYHPVCRFGERVGRVTSGTCSPASGAGFGLAYVPAELAKSGMELEIDIQGRLCPAIVTGKPFNCRGVIRPASAVRQPESEVRIA